MFSLQACTNSCHMVAALDAEGIYPSAVPKSTKPQYEVAPTRTEQTDNT